MTDIVNSAVNEQICFASTHFAVGEAVRLNRARRAFKCYQGICKKPQLSEQQLVRPFVPSPLELEYFALQQESFPDNQIMGSDEDDDGTTESSEGDDSDTETTTESQEDDNSNIESTTKSQDDGDADFVSTTETTFEEKDEDQGVTDN